jgi:hypothetical protein
VAFAVVPSIRCDGPSAADGIGQMDGKRGQGEEGGGKMGKLGMEDLRFED